MDAGKRARIGLGALLITLPAGSAAAIECGEVIGEDATLDRDLVCQTDPALTVDRGAELNLGWFTVVCDGTATGIRLEGASTRLDDGGVVGCSVAVVVAGDGSHTVRQVTASGLEQGILVLSDDNHIVRSAVLRGWMDAAIQVDGSANTLYANAVTGSIDQGFEVNGDHNLIRNNQIGAVAEGVQLTGTGNRVLDNDIIGTTDRGIEVRVTVTDDGTEIREGSHEIRGNRIADGTADGIAIFSDGNLVIDNSIYGNGDQGLFVSGFGNTITDNRVLLNLTDLTDATDDCDDNRWQDNVFETSVSDDCVD
jgi:hypothetical protein